MKVHLTRMIATHCLIICSDTKGTGETCNKPTAIHLIFYLIGHESCVKSVIASGNLDRASFGKSWLVALNMASERVQDHEDPWDRTERHPKLGTEPLTCSPRLTRIGRGS